MEYAVLCITAERSADLVHVWCESGREAIKKAELYNQEGGHTFRAVASVHGVWTSLTGESLYVEAARECLCPGDCNCRHTGQPYRRVSFCGCKAHA